jgi:hypothetical protein
VEPCFFQQKAKWQPPSVNRSAAELVPSSCCLQCFSSLRILSVGPLEVFVCFLCLFLKYGYFEESQWGYWSDPNVCFRVPNHAVNWQEICASKLRFSGRPSKEMVNESSTEHKALQTSHHCRRMQDSSVKTWDRASLELSFGETLWESYVSPYVWTFALWSAYETFISR